MSDDLFRELNASAQRDQMIAALTTVANQVGTYRKALLAEGLTPDDVRNLVREWHHLMWCKLLWPGSPPYISPGEGE